MTTDARARWTWLALALVVAALAAACGPKAPPTIAPTAPQFPDFVFPASAADDPPGLRSAQEAGWRALQAGDLKSADRAFRQALKARPAYVPADTALGYLALAHRQANDALARFDRVLQRSDHYAPALVGRGEALVALGRDADALASYEAARAADPTLDLGARIEVLRFRGAGDAVQEARRAAEHGQLDAARAAYERAIAASPDSPFLYRELGSVEARAGNDARALELFARASAADPTDPRAHVLAGDLLAKDGRYADAVTAYAAALAIEASPDVEQKRTDAQQKADLATLPAEYRAIPSAAEVTRADVAAVLGIRLASWLAALPATPGQLMTDIRTNWAASWILTVVRAGVMEAFPNHTFQPNGRMRRADLARVIARTLSLSAQRASGAPRAWQSARVAIADVPATHPSYPAISTSLAAGVLRVNDDGTFQPGRPVTGAELMQTADRLEALVGAGAARRP